MAGEWRPSNWGDEVILEYGKAIRGYSQTQGKYRVFGSNGPIGWTSESLVQGPGVILGRKGAYRGVEYWRGPFWVIDTAYYLVPKTELDMRWLYYAVKHYKLGEVDDGSPIPSTTRAAVYMLELDVPPKPEQRAIAHILGTLDDKIELNHRRNLTLEAMARALFQDWFVDFGPVRAKFEGRAPYLPPDLWNRFPDRLDNGGKPEGWEVKPLLDLTTLITKGTTPTKENMNSAPESDAQITYVRVNSIDEKGFVIDANLTSIPKSVHAGVLKRSILKSNDILYTIAGTIGRMAVVEEWLLPANTNQAVAIIRPQPPIPVGFLIQTLRQEGFREELHNSIVQAVQANLSLGTLAKARVIVPPEHTLAKIFSPIDNIFSMISANRGQSRTLAQLRDTLLPKLISGELRIREAEAFLRDRVS